MSDIDVVIGQMTKAYSAAAAAKDVGAFMRLYDANVRVFDAWECWSYEGAPAWQSAVQSWFGSLGEDTVLVTFDETQVTGGNEFAIASALVTYAGIAANGEMLHSLQNRITWGISLVNAVPRIVHEHTSAPIKFDGMKAILKR